MIFKKICWGPLPPFTSTPALCYIMWNKRKMQHTHGGITFLILCHPGIGANYFGQCFAIPNFIYVPVTGILLLCRSLDLSPLTQTMFLWNRQELNSNLSPSILCGLTCNQANVVATIVIINPKSSFLFS